MLRTNTFSLVTISVLLMSGVTGMAQPLNLDLGFAPMITIPANVDAALPLPDGRLVVAGLFHLLNGELHSGLAALLPDGTVDKTFSGSLLGLLNQVAAITWQPDGKFIAGAERIYRFNGDGSLDSTFNAGRGVIYSQPRRPLWALATYPDGKIVAGGQFEWAQDQVRFDVARFHANGSLDESFNAAQNYPGFLPISPAIALAPQADGKLVAAANKYVFGFTSSGAKDPDFRPALPGPGEGLVAVLVQQPDGRLLLGGNFMDKTGTNRLWLARLNRDGSEDESFRAVHFGASDEVPFARALALQPDGRLVIAGTIGESIPESYPLAPGRLFVKRVNANGSVDETFSPPPLSADAVSPLLTLKLQVLSNGNILFVAPLSGLAVRLHADGTVDRQFDIVPETPPQLNVAGTEKSGAVILFQTFLGAKPAPRAVVRVFPDGRIDETFTPGKLPLVSSLYYLTAVALQPDGKIILGGTTGSGAQLIRLGADGELDATFQSGSSANATPSVLVALEDGRIVFGGSANYVVHSDGQPLGTYLGRVNSDGSPDPSFRPVLPSFGEIGSIIPLAGKKLLVSGNGLTDDFLRRLNEDGSTDTTFNPAVAGSLAALQHDGKILVLTGNRRELLRLEPNGSLDPNFRVSIDDSRLLYGIQAMAVLADDGVVVSGYNGILRFQPAGTEDRYFQHTFGLLFYSIPQVGSMVVNEDGSLYASGAFSAVDGKTRFSVARFRPAPRFLDAERRPDGTLRWIIDNTGGAPYRVESSTDFREWSPFGAVNANVLRPSLDVAPELASQRFFRVRVD